MTTTTSTHLADIRAIQAQGCDPMPYADALARRWSVSSADASAIIARVGGTPRTVDPETVAQERLAEDLRQRHGRDARHFNHEE